MLHAILKKIVGSKNDRELKRLSLILDEINVLEPALKALSDAELLAVLMAGAGPCARQVGSARRLLAALRPRRGRHALRGEDAHRRGIDQRQPWMGALQHPARPEDGLQLLGGRDAVRDEALREPEHRSARGCGRAPSARMAETSGTWS